MFSPFTFSSSVSKFRPLRMPSATDCLTSCLIHSFPSLCPMLSFSFHVTSQTFFRYHSNGLCVRTMASVQPRMTAACFCNCQCTWLMMATVSCYMHHDGHLTAQVIAWHFVHFEMCLPLNLLTCYHGERRRTIRERGVRKTTCTLGQSERPTGWG